VKQMSLFDKLQPITAARQKLADRGITSNVVMDKVLSSTEAIINGRRMILAGTNNYMGLTFDADCIAAASQAAQRLGTGTTGSRMANVLMRIVSPPHHRRPKDLAPEPPAPGWPTAPIPVMSS
jgi:7-keto-8-aminopelargonate synthetase-like enzyme